MRAFYCRLLRCYRAYPILWTMSVSVCPSVYGGDSGSNQIKNSGNILSFPALAATRSMCAIVELPPQRVLMELYIFWKSHQHTGNPNTRERIPGRSVGRARTHTHTRTHERAHIFPLAAGTFNTTYYCYCIWNASRLSLAECAILIQFWFLFKLAFFWCRNDALQIELPGAFFIRWIPWALATYECMDIFDFGFIVFASFVFLHWIWSTIYGIIINSRHNNMERRHTYTVTK